MKLILKIIGLVLTINILLSSAVAGAQPAYNEKTLQELGIYFVDLNPKTKSSCSDPLFGPHFPQLSDTAAFTQAIEDYLKNTRPDSPLIGHGAEFVQFGQQYNVNPAFIVALAQAETSLGVAGNAKPPQYNIFSIRNGPNSSFGSYPSIKDAIEAVNQLISGGKYLGPPSNLTTFEKILEKYNPGGDQPYLNFVTDVIQKILSPFQTALPTASTTENCGTVIGGPFNFGNYASLSREELIKRLYGSGHWKPLKSFDEDKDGIPDATEDIDNGTAKESLLRLLVAAVETLNIDLYPSVIKIGHSACSPISHLIYDHMYGVAIDLTEAGGNDLTETLATWFYQNRVALNVDELIYTPMPADTTTLENGLSYSFGSAVLAQHTTHIHVSVDRVVRPPC